MSYEQKLDIANNYLWKNYGIFWNDLGDTNDLHYCETEEDIINKCEERINNE